MLNTAACLISSLSVVTAKRLTTAGGVVDQWVEVYRLSDIGYPVDWEGFIEDKPGEAPIEKKRGQDMFVYKRGGNVVVTPEHPTMKAIPAGFVPWHLRETMKDEPLPVSQQTLARFLPTTTAKSSKFQKVGPKQYKVMEMIRASEVGFPLHARLDFKQPDGRILTKDAGRDAFFAQVSFRAVLVCLEDESGYPVGYEPHVNQMRGVVAQQILRNTLLSTKAKPIIVAPGGSD